MHHSNNKFCANHSNLWTLRFVWRFVLWPMRSSSSASSSSSSSPAPSSPATVGLGLGFIGAPEHRGRPGQQWWRRPPRVRGGRWAAKMARGEETRWALADGEMRLGRRARQWSLRQTTMAAGKREEAAANGGEGSRAGVICFECDANDIVVGR